MDGVAFYESWCRGDFINHLQDQFERLAKLWYENAVRDYNQIMITGNAKQRRKARRMVERGEWFNLHRFNPSGTPIGDVIDKLLKEALQK